LLCEVSNLAGHMCSESSTLTYSENPALRPLWLLTTLRRVPCMTHRTFLTTTTWRHPFVSEMKTVYPRILTRLRLSHAAFGLSVRAKTYSSASCGPFPASTRPFAKPRAQLPWQTCYQKSQCRGARKKATVKLDDIPQGAIETIALPAQDDSEPDYPPLLQQVRNNMLKFSHCVLLTRVGGFYEVRDCFHAQRLLMVTAIFRTRG
jgi:hypothetical protein